MANNQHVNELFRAYLAGRCTHEELDALLRYFDLDAPSDQLMQLILQEFEQPVPADVDQDHVRAINQRVNIRLGAHTQAVGKRRIRYMRWLPYAAAVLIVVTAAISMFYSDRIAGLTGRQVNGLSTASQGDADSKGPDAILPGGNRATLTLADGRVINLDETQTGIVVGAEDITYNDGSDLKLADGGRGEKPSTAMLSLTTPKGGTYQLTLPDGSKVWLNSVAKIAYPRTFSGDTREIQLWGEAFFEVQSRPKQPFVVRTKALSITVLGTAFNVSAYDDEPSMSATVSEGSVRVTHGSSTAVVRAGQRALLGLADQRLSLQQANVDQALAWKNGYFHFDGVKVDAIMRQLERWYDLDVSYGNRMPDVEFSGIMQRKENANQVFEILEETGSVAFKLNGRKVTVHPVNQTNK